MQKWNIRGISPITLTLTILTNVIQVPTSLSPLCPYSITRYDSKNEFIQNRYTSGSSTIVRTCNRATSSKGYYYASCGSSSIFLWCNLGCPQGESNKVVKLREIYFLNHVLATQWFHERCEKHWYRTCCIAHRANSLCSILYQISVVCIKSPHCQNHVVKLKKKCFHHT